MPDILTQFFGNGSTSPGTQFPAAAASLINDTTSITLDVESGKTYLVRMVSVAALFPHVVSFEGHRKSHFFFIDRSPLTLGQK
jgi:hypothetical protein